MIKRISYLVAVSLLGISCNRDNNEDNSAKTDISSLSKVEFADQASKLVSSKKTGETRYNPANNATEFEYLNEVETPHTISPLSFIDNDNRGVIYPGSILRGSSFITGGYDPLVLSTPYNDVMVSVSFRGGNNLWKSPAQPILRQIRNTIDDLVEKYKYEVDIAYNPTSINYLVKEVNTIGSFNRVTNLHKNKQELEALLSGKFNYIDNYKSSKSPKYVMVRLSQSIYNVSIDSKHYTEWFNGNVPIKEFGSHEPVYVSSVDYGKAAYLLIETDVSEETVKKIVPGAIDFSFKATTQNANASHEKEMKRLFSDSKIRVIAVGGLKVGQKINSYESLLEFIKTPNLDLLRSSAAPISYKVRRLKDNTEVEVKSILTEKVLEYKKD